jgi:hypothetical protein
MTGGGLETPKKPTFSGRPTAQPGKATTPPKGRDTGQTVAKRGKPGFFRRAAPEKTGREHFFL